MAVDENVLITAAYPKGVQEYLGFTDSRSFGERLQNLYRNCRFQIAVHKEIIPNNFEF